MTVCLLAPLIVSMIYFDAGNNNGWMQLLAFIIPALLCTGLGLGLRSRYGQDKDLGRREGFAVVTLSWLLMTLVGMLPYLISGSIPGVTDAFFETMSGFTTTGATILPRVEVLPRGVQFWRHMTQWLGGMGVVVLSVALLRFLGIGGYRLLKAESLGGVAFQRDKPRVTEIASDLWKLYLGISSVQIILLRLGGMTLYDAFCHTFTTMSTGGFSTHSASIAYFTSPFVQWTIIAFMLIAGINFSLHAQLIRLRPMVLLRNPEFQLYAGIIFVAVVAGLLFVPYPGHAEKHLRDVAFQVISISTTTGYATVDFDQWPHLMRLILVLLMFAGGCTGSTGGGIKSARLLIYAKALLRELHLLIYPHAVRPIRVGDKVMDRMLVFNIMTFGSIFAALFIIGTLVMAACGYDIETSASASVAALSNIGPGLGKVGATANWSHLPAFAKWVMSILMLLGRLELFSVLILFTPWAWKR